jgi:hypothetical protein
MTFRSPPLTVPELERLERDVGSRFSSLKAFVDSWQACKDWYGEKHYTITVDAAREWMERDLERDQVLHFQFATTPDPLAESHPSQYQIPDLIEQHAIERGDLHDWSQLEPVRHAARCIRCQLGAQSARRNADRALAAGKQPVTFGNVLRKLYGDHLVRCVECGALEDEPGTDACQRSFWHLPDIWLTLHPGQTLEDMGQLGPFMRGFLRRQRPAIDADA